jgi:hypothetical protein
MRRTSRVVNDAAVLGLAQPLVELQVEVIL